jgi:hypothetical protein
LSVRGGATARFLPGERLCFVPNWASRLLVGGGITDPALACFSFSPLRTAAAAFSARSTTASSPSSRVINSVVSHCCQGICESVNVGARSGFERHVRGGLSLGKSEGCSKSCRVPFKQELANLLANELCNELFNQGKVVVNFFARIRAVVEVAKTGMPSSDVLGRDFISDVYSVRD